MKFLTLDTDSFRYGEAEQLAPLVRRVIADNPSKFTYRGTGTYIVGLRDVVVIDPGPKLDSHRDALAAALAGSSVRAILITHCHADHSPLAAWLAAETGAPTIAFGPHGTDAWDIGEDPVRDDPASDEESEASEPVIEESTDTDFVPDEAVATGEEVVSGNGWTMTAMHTPGHTSNHMCFALDDGTTRTIFTGDHVMGWSTTVVSPPDGDMSAYLESLRMVAGRNDDVAIPTHGSPIPNPTEFVNDLIEHRLQREAQVLEAVRSGLDTIPAMVEVLYAHVRKELHSPARRSVLAHLVKLVDEQVVVLAGEEPRPRLDSRFLGD
ncbi:MAG: MBL fold metallo-hydrolase [Actinobacteria bacterium]|nr:MBL fold metallo-hydrolase [Actinomycetota bacterium]